MEVLEPHIIPTACGSIHIYMFGVLGHRTRGSLGFMKDHTHFTFFTLPLETQFMIYDFLP